MQNGGQAEDEMMMDSLCYFKNCLITHFDTRAVFSIYLILLLLGRSALLPSKSMQLFLKLSIHDLFADRGFSFPLHQKKISHIHTSSINSGLDIIHAINSAPCKGSLQVKFSIKHKNYQYICNTVSFITFHRRVNVLKLNFGRSQA